MTKKIKFIFLLVALTGIGHISVAARGGSRYQTTASDLIKEIQTLLVQQGFENIVLKSRLNGMVVEYENRRYRYEMRAMGVVCAVVSKSCNNIDWLILIPKNRDIPLVQVRINLRDYQSFITGEISAKMFGSRLEISQDPATYESGSSDMLYRTNPANNSFRKIDLFINPDINARLGNYDDPYKWQINIIPEISTFPLKGMKASAEIIIPLENEWGEEGEDVRPGKVMLNQTWRFPHQIFSSFSSGYFEPNRYGFSIELLKFLFNGDLSISAKADYTGFLIFFDKHWYYSDLNKWTYLLSGAYQFSPLDFSVSLSQGRFLMGDAGWRADVVRSFGEIDVAFFAIKTSAEKLGGLSFSLPIFPMRRLAPRRIRVNPPLYFGRTYRYLFTDYGTSVYTGCLVRDFMKRLTPGYIRNHAKEFKVGD